MARTFVPMPEHLRKPASERKPRKSGPSGKRKTPREYQDNSLFTRGNFVAIDGEGFDEGKELTTSIEGNAYVYRPHYYALLASSDGGEVCRLSGRLSTQDCLEFLFDCGARNPRGIFVIFSGSYDVTQFFAHGIKRVQAIDLLGSAKYEKVSLDITVGNYDYRIRCIPRKNLTLMRWPKGTDKYIKTKRGGWKQAKHEKFILWDVWGFFQGSFAEVMKKWIPDDPDYNFIVRMKALRGDDALWKRDEMDEVRRYNQAELRCLVEVMNRLRQSIAALGLKITRWDGAGALAGAMNAKHGVKQAKAGGYTPAFVAACHAYSGGHIEVCKIGYHQGEVHHYDINSAYPAEFINLPDLSAGRWISAADRQGEAPPPGFTLVRVEFSFLKGMPFYPLFYREKDGTILYPRIGEGWYWYPEYDAAAFFAEAHGATVFRVLDWWHFATSAPRPFAWVADYYNRRQALVAEAKRLKIENGEEKIIKLGLNSLYGKTMQQVGARLIDDEMVPPAYFQIEWGGYVTAGCRAKLMQAALQCPDAIISFATDGLFSLEPLNLDCPTDKVLGAWEYQVHAGITMVMPGVYWLHDMDDLGRMKSKHYSRGFDKDKMQNPQIVHSAWAKGDDEIAMDTRRLIGLGTASGSKHFWKMRGCFVKTTRMLRLDGFNSKRMSITVSSKKPHRGLVATKPKLADAPEGTLSEAYDIRFLTSPVEDAKQRAEDEAEREEIDAEEA